MPSSSVIPTKRSAWRNPFSTPSPSGNVVTTWQTYDANNQLTKQTWKLGSTTYSETFTYGTKNGLLATHTPAVGNKLTFGYDNLQRLTGVTGGIYGKAYTYRDISGTDKTTTQVSQLKYDLPTDITYGYTYDVLGNIATYTENGTQYTYTYDALNQLKTQTDGEKTYTYTYDAAGNILTASDGTTSHSYTYGNGTWKDLLTKFDGETISYDNSGNPTSYYNGTRWSMAWEEGRRLVSASGDGKSLTFTYDSEGLRLTKKVGSTTYSYTYAGGKLMRQTWGSNTIDFFYDTTGNPYALKYNGTLYYYITNLQGDVLHIVNTSGTPVVSYTYDPYGKPEDPTGTEATTLGAHNPLRYRGYVYDTETGLYYVSSRYYDPTLGRFVNADVLVSTGEGMLGYNMFAYCLNNPVCREDTLGTTSQECFNSEDVDHTDDNKEFDGGRMGDGSSTNQTKKVGSGHGNNVHKDQIDKHMDKLVKTGKYSVIYGNRSLKTAGLNGSQRPDVIAVGTDGRVEIWEFASPSQFFGAPGYFTLQAKIDIMQAANPSAIVYPVIYL